MSKKIISIGLVCSLVLLILSAKIYVPQADEKDLENLDASNITVWYTDEAMTAYLNEAAIAYQELTGIKVAVHMTSGLEYLEGIQKASVLDSNGPDAYIINSDSLEKARLAGLASEVEDKEGVLNTQNFPEVALHAVTYQDMLLGYPFTYETAALFYNDTYLTNMARLALEAESGAEESEDTAEEEEASDANRSSEGLSEEAVLEKKEAIFPTSMVGLLEFANSYEPDSNMQTFLVWDVADIMFNYGFGGAYMNVGGVHGDDRAEIDVYNTEAMYCLSVYQDYNQFFSMDAEEVDYDSVVEDFISGRTMFTIGGTDMLNSAQTAVDSGTFMGSYGVASVEMLNDTLAYKPLSVTNAVVINEYSEKQAAAEDFAQFLTCEYVHNLYARSGKLCAFYLQEYPVAAMEDMMTCYENSVSLPKIVENSNYWVLAELCYTNIWSGKDVNAELMSLSQQVKKEISGEEVQELQLETPVVTESYIKEE